MAALKIASDETPDTFEASRGIETYKDWCRDAEDAHSDARKLSHRDRDWYDNYDDTQWSEEEKAVLKKRGQPLVTMNRIKRKVNFLCGVEQKSRSDPKAYPRKPQNTDQAQVATDVLDYIENTIRFDKVASASFKCLSIEGIEAVDVCYEQGQGAYGVCAKEIDFDQFFYDPRSRKPDFSDARYLGYHNWYDLEDAQAMFPDAKDILASSTAIETGTDKGSEDKPNFQWGDAKRKRVRVACMYWKAADGGWNYVYFCGSGIIEEGASKYLDADGKTDCPIIAGSAYVTRENERYGAVRDMISPQMEMNFRRSMALFLAKNRRLWSKTGVFGSEQNPKVEVAKADAHLIANGEFGSDWGFIESGNEIAQNFELLQDAKQEIDAQGPNAGLQGRGVENQSGRAIMAQQQAGLAEENTLFDTHNDWKLRVYRAMWARAKQFWKEEIWLRIADDEAEEGARFTPLNQPAPMQMPGMGQMGQPQPGPMGMAPPQMGMTPPMGGMPPQQPQGPMPGMGQPPMGAPPQQPSMGGMPGMMGMPPPKPSIMNSLAEMDVDIIIEAAPDLLTLQHEQFEQLAQMAGNGVPIPPDVLLEASQIRDKKKLIQRMKEDMDLQAKLQQAGQQAEQMQKMVEQLQKQLQQAEQKAQMAEMKASMPQPQDPAAMAKVQQDGARLQLEARKADREDALAQAKIMDMQAGMPLTAAQVTKTEADTFKTVQDAMRPPPQVKPKG